MLFFAERLVCNVIGVFQGAICRVSGGLFGFPNKLSSNNLCAMSCPGDEAQPGACRHTNSVFLYVHGIGSLSTFIVKHFTRDMKQEFKFRKAFNVYKTC